MIRRSLSDTQRATFSVDLPEARSQGLPRPAGTGFFVSADGWFITAAHVITQDGTPTGPARADINKSWLMKESRPGQFSSGMCEFATLDAVFPAFDIAVLKVDFSLNSNKDHLRGLAGFPHLSISRRPLDEGEPVYAFGYPLTKSQVMQGDGGSLFGHAAYAPRTTSAIVSASMEETLRMHSEAIPQTYVLDKALNYGNSGGPIVSVETGRVHALCSRFQPMAIPQRHIIIEGKPAYIVIPSLYGIVSSLTSSLFLPELEKRGIPVDSL